MKKLRPTPNLRPETSAPVRTGEHCPESGWWLPATSAEHEAASRFVGQGSLMPTFAGTPSAWIPSQEH